MRDSIFVVLGNQLFPVARVGGDLPRLVFMAEDRGLCTHYKYHHFKIVLFLAAMRNYREELRGSGFEVRYFELNQDSKSYFERLAAVVKKEGVKKIICYEIEDRFFEVEMRKFVEVNGLELEVIMSPGFLTGRDEFKSYLEKVKNKPFMKSFYEWQRKRLGILVDKNGKPEGGKWSFDSENRKKLPTKYVPAERIKPKIDEVVREVFELVKAAFPEHPAGEIEDFWLAVKREDALKIMKKALAQLNEFGEYEDAISRQFDFINHTTLSPYLNLGIILPEEVVEEAVLVYERGLAPINSVEGFVRQVIGWREFVRGVYQNFGEVEEESNFFGHKRKLPEFFYKGNSGIEPLDYCVKKVQRLGYLHHIERLMIVGNLMLLMEIEPKEVNRWFMEMFVDSSDWVMTPNVFGMSQFADGGIFATKPYISGSNYVLKMSDFKKGDWSQEWDDLYWRFIGKNLEFFKSQYRLSMMARLWEKMPEERKERLLKMKFE